MASIKEKRKKIMDYLIMVMDGLDPSGVNSEYYKKLYGKMSDAEFAKEMDEFFKDDKANLYLECVEYKNDLTLENIEKTAKKMNVPLYEYVYLPHVNGDAEDNIVKTPQPVPVGWIHEKRPMQMLHKKNSGSTNIGNRNPLTGQVTGDDKNARNSDVESYALLAIGAEKALAEFLGPRADDAVAKNDMLTDIANNGYTSLDNLTSEKGNKVALSTLDIRFISQGFKTNLITGGNLLPSMQDVTAEKYGDND